MRSWWLALLSLLGWPSWLQATVEAHRRTVIEALEVSPGKRASGTLRSLLRLAGYRVVREVLLFPFH